MTATPMDPARAPPDGGLPGAMWPLTDGPETAFAAAVAETGMTPPGMRNAVPARGG